MALNGGHDSAVLNMNQMSLYRKYVKRGRKEFDCVCVLSIIWLKAEWIE